MSAKPKSAATLAEKAPRRKKRRTPILRRRLAGVSITVQRCTMADYVACVTVHPHGAKRKTKYFETVEAAKAFAHTQEIAAANSGARAASEIGPNEQRVMLHAKEALAAHGKTLADAVSFYLTHLQASDKSATVSAVIKSLTEQKEKADASSRYLGDLRSRLGRFERTFGKRSISDVAADEVGAWLHGLDLSPVGTNNFRRVLAVLFNYAAARKFCPAGIMRQTDRVKEIEAEPSILTVAECAALLHAADPKVRAGLALALFTGIRDAELMRLDWRAVDLESESLIVGAGVSKLAQRRVIPIRENLRGWLEPLRQLGGPIMPTAHESRWLVVAARRAVGFGSMTPEDRAAGLTLRPWPNNALRHSYASYRLAQWPDAAALALEMGNSPAVILEHYRALVKPAAAEAFWKITPRTAAAGNVVAMEKKTKPASGRRTKSA